MPERLGGHLSPSPGQDVLIAHGPMMLFPPGPRPYRFLSRPFAAWSHRAPALSSRGAHVCASAPGLSLCLCSSAILPFLSRSLSYLFSEPGGLLPELPFSVFSLDALVNTERGGWAGERPGPGASHALSPAVPRWMSPPQRGGPPLPHAIVHTHVRMLTHVHAHAYASTHTWLIPSSMPSWGEEGGL